MSDQLNELVTNRELSQKLKELGYPQSLSTFYWAKIEGADWQVFYTKNYMNDAIAAPLADELWNRLPEYIIHQNEQYSLITYKYYRELKRPLCQYRRYDEHGIMHICAISTDDTLSDCFAKMLVWLITTEHMMRW
jgi:hypothetical protein